MTVAELIKALSVLPADAPVYVQDQTDVDDVPFWCQVAAVDVVADEVRLRSAD